MLPILKRLDKGGDSDEVVYVMRYFLKEGNVADKNRFLSTLYSNHFSLEVKNEMMTVADQLRQEGRQEGREMEKRKNIEIAKSLMDRKTFAKFLECLEVEDFCETQY